MNAKLNDFEIMAPVGSRESLSAAIQAGADSIYFGVGKLNMRSHSANHFDISDLKEIASVCRDHGIKSYLTVNTIIYDNDLADMVVFAKKVAKALRTAFPCRKVGMAVLGLEVNHAHIHLVPLQSEGDMDFRRAKLQLTPEQMQQTADRILAAYEAR